MIRMRRKKGKREETGGWKHAERQMKPNRFKKKKLKKEEERKGVLPGKS